MRHYLILKIVSRKLKILIVIINLSPVGVYVFFLNSVCIVLSFWGGGGAGGDFHLWDQRCLSIKSLFFILLYCAHIF